jgi:iron complex transport system substrate-binding protein
MVEAAGGVDVLTSAGSISRRIDWNTLHEASPNVIVLMPCGFTIERTRAELAAVTGHPRWKTLTAVQTGAVFLVDALAYFSRPGPRLIDGVEQLAAIFRATGKDDRLPRSVEPLDRPATLPR